MKKKYLILSILFFVVFIFFTITLLFVDRSPIGPNSAVVGYGAINNWFHNLTGVHFTLYNITDIAEIPPIAMGMSFGVVGLIQWIKRKKLFKVDYELLILGCFYILVFLIYLVFEFMVINRRPVLIDGVHEASYPSSTTFLAITFMLSALVPINKYVKSEKLKKALNIICYIYMIFLEVVRLICGVHWLTDIIGAIIMGISIICIYNYFILLFKPVEKND